VTKPVTLQGAGPTRTTVRGLELGQPVITVGPLEPGAEVVLSGIAFAGASGSCSEPGGCAHGLLVREGASVRAERCAFSGNAGSGVAAQGQVELHDCTITGNIGYGVRADGQARVSLASVTVEESRSAGIWVADFAEVRLARTTVTKGEGPGAWVRDQGRLVATASAISDCAGHGLWVRDRASAELSGSTLARHRDAGAWVEHEARLVLTSSTVEGTWDGVVARDRAVVQVAQSRIANVRWDGVKVQGGAQATVVGSTLSSGRGTGVRTSEAAQAELAGNRITGWTAQGVLSLSSFAPTGEGNAFADNGVDLVGNVPGSLRAPLHPAVHMNLRFPHPAYPSLQAAVDALLPGGTLVLAEGIYVGGVTVGKPLRIEAAGVVLLTAKAPGESAVVSLVGGADLVLVGVALGEGSEGVVLGADARASLTDCVVSDNSRGVHVADGAEIRLLRCRLSRNSQGGLGVWDRGGATLRECAFTANGMFGISAAGRAQVVVEDCLITESGWNGGVILGGSAEAELWGNSIVRNYGTGIALYHGLCLGTGRAFTGRVRGGRNELAGNYKGDTCPRELGFLAGEGGELDWRR